MCRVTRVIIAQSIITKVNKSLYVTIGTSSLLLYPAAEYIVPSVPRLSTLLFEIVAVYWLFWSLYKIISKLGIENTGLFEL